MEKNLRKVDKKLTRKDGLDVRMAMEVVRTEVILQSLPRIQFDLWNDLLAASKFGNFTLVQQVYENSDAGLADLVDLLYVADQLAFNNPAVTLENAAFFQVIYELLGQYKGVQLDEVIGGCFGTKFSSVERYLLYLCQSPKLIKSRLNSYALIRSSSPNKTSKKGQIAVLRDWQGAVSLAMINLKKLRAGFTEEEAVAYLLLLENLKMEFDQTNIPLIASLKHGNFVGTMLESLIDKLKKGVGWKDHLSGFNSVMAAYVRKAPERSLKKVVNSGLEEIFDERLLALSMLCSVEGIENQFLMELVLDADKTEHSDADRLRSKLKQKIRRSGILSDRGWDLGANRMI